MRTVTADYLEARIKGTVTQTLHPESVRRLVDLIERECSKEAGLAKAERERHRAYEIEMRNERDRNHARIHELEQKLVRLAEKVVDLTDA